MALQVQGPSSDCSVVGAAVMSALLAGAWPEMWRPSAIRVAGIRGKDSSITYSRQATVIERLLDQRRRRGQADDPARAAE